MEASENRSLPREGCEGTDLHRIDPERVTGLPRGDRQAAGLTRLDVMLTRIIPRLFGDAEDAA